MRWATDGIRPLLWFPHMAVPRAEAEAIADYLETDFADPRVKAGAIDLSTFSKQEAAFGEKIFTEHACIGCHQIRSGEKTIGGAQSSSFVDAGGRLKGDWIHRFNSNPPDFVPHSGEFAGDVSELGLRYVTASLPPEGGMIFRSTNPGGARSLGRRIWTGGGGLRTILFAVSRRDWQGRWTSRIGAQPQAGGPHQDSI